MPAFRISLAEWSLHRALFGGKITNLDFPRLSKSQFGIEAVEYVNQFSKDKARDQAYLKELKTICEGEGVRCVLIMCDGEGNLGDPDPARQAQAVENHGGLSSNGNWLAGVMKKVGLPNCGTLPDFGNFRVTSVEMYDRYQGTAELMPNAKGVSAKSYDFDPQGNETTIDYKRMLKVVMDTGYHGYIGVEYEGRRLDEPAGIRATKHLLERLRGELGEPK